MTIPASYLTDMKGAIIDSGFRYLLWRRWNPELPIMQVIGLNPSTADASRDDPTMGKLRAAAIRLGYGELVICNLFALQDPKPAVMRAASDPVGPLNDSYIAHFAANSQKIVAAWGEEGSFRGRDSEVIQLVQNLDCFAFNLSGQPRHVRTPGRYDSLLSFARAGRREWPHPRVIAPVAPDGLFRSQRSSATWERTM